MRARLVKRIRREIERGTYAPLTSLPVLDAVADRVGQDIGLWQGGEILRLKLAADEAAEGVVR